MIFAYVALFAGIGQFARATHINGPLDAGLRTTMPGEGYLEFKIPPTNTNFGEEWTGWVDIRHPVLDGTTSVASPFDRADRFVDVKTITVTDGAGFTANPAINRDFNFANKVWMQMGMSVLAEDHDFIAFDGSGPPFMLFSFDTGAEDDAMKEFARSPNASTVNLWYIVDYDSATLLGLASPPAAFGGNMPRNDGIGMADAALDNTLAHELGHMILNGGNAIHMAAPNIMAPFNNNRTFSQIGPVAAVDTFTNGQVTDAFTPPDAGMPLTNNAGLVQSNAEDHRFGNRVDWDFVVDHAGIEGIDDADNHSFADVLFFEIGTAAVGAHPAAHNHTGLGAFAHPGDFAGASFRTADVFSLALLYSDYDQAAGLESLREKALDYDLFFRAANGQLVPGQLVKIFEPGWSPSTNADDFLARWLSPIDATGVLILGHGGDGHEGTTQIDAVIVSQVPEPSTIALLAVGLLVTAVTARRTRRQT